MARFRLAAVFALLLSGLAVVAGAAAGTASASTGPGHTIAAAGALTVGDSASGGGGPIDFWTVHLNGGDRVQFAVSTSVANYFEFQLYAPGTADTGFPSAVAVSGGNTYDVARTVVDLQAPYNGTFVLAVCENAANYTCTSTASGGAANPMDTYTFTTSFATSVSSATAAREVRAGSDIASSRQLGAGNFEAGGGNAVDFWKVHLNGGDRVQFAVSTSVANYFEFQLYAPGTADTGFPSAVAVSGGNTYDVARTVIDLQAPYSGTFVLAVCENANNYTCTSTATGGAANPMDTYTFTPTLIGGGVPGAVAGKETKASPVIGGARLMGLGHFEAGGGNAVDFWKMRLNGGDRVQFAVSTSVANYFEFQLFPPGTTDTSFPSALAVSGGNTYDVAKTVIDLSAPRTGTYVLAVCENANNYTCTSTASGGAANPVDPYTFTARQAGGRESRTYLSLSARTIRYHHERGLKFRVHVVSVYGSGRPTGRVYISDGKATVCSARLVRGYGTCSPPVSTKIRVGKYWIRAYYHGGNRYNSASGRTRLTVGR